MTKFFKLLSIFFFIFNLSSSTAQIKIFRLQQVNFNKFDPLFLGITSTRKITSLNLNWSVYPSDKKDERVNINLPSVYKVDKSITFSKNFYLTNYQIENSTMFLKFFGLSYSADIYLNNLIIYRHTGGAVPFSIKLDKSMLNGNGQNFLEIKIENNLTAKTTIPVKQRFLFPQNLGGMLRGVYLEILPKIYISKSNVDYTFSKKYSVTEIKINTEIKVNERSQNKIKKENSFVLKFQLKTLKGNIVKEKSTPKFSMDNYSTPKIISGNFQIQNLSLWTPAHPVNYILTTLLFKNDSLIDKFQKSLSVFSISKNRDGFLLNGKKFSLKGVTYILSDIENDELPYPKNIIRDLRIIKKTGFNSVRFAKSIPDPYALKECSRLGLLAFIELPINSEQPRFTENVNFIKRSKKYLTLFLNGFSKYQSIAAIGLGSSYIANSVEQVKYLTLLSKIVKDRTNFLTYASFIGIPKTSIADLDFYGIELYNKSPEYYFSSLKKNIPENNRYNYFISSATYPNMHGISNGYLNPYSYEAQAKYFSGVIDFAKKINLSGFFINTMFDYSGDYTSFFAGYSRNNLYHIGILPANRKTERFTYKVLNAKLNKTGRISIPIGTKKSNSPMFFILFALILSIIMALLINSKRQFREDATRALMRPYNFYSDIRDLRILSGIHTFILMFVLAGAHSLLLTIVLYYVRMNFLLEKVLLAFASPFLMKIISYLAWNPMQCFFYLFIFSIILFLLLSLFFKGTSFFVKQKVFLSNIYFVVIWSFLPLSLLLPLELVLHKILLANVVNIYIYIILGIFLFWTVQRLLKGIYVIFDIRPSLVYFYSIGTFIIIIATVLIYFQLANSSIDYIITAIRQYRLL